MATAGDPTVRDPDLDGPPSSARRPAVLTSLDPFDPPERYQRLVANPFLAILGLLGWIVLMRAIDVFEQPALFLPTILSLGLIPFLFQYHCLDCGATGRQSRHRQHACERVRLRREAGRPRRFRGPRVPIQTLLWLAVMLVFALVLIVTL